MGGGALKNRGMLIVVGGVLILCLISYFSLTWRLDSAGFSTPETREFVLWNLRIPRLLMGFVVGATLSLAGAAFQTLFRNPLATPSTVGTTAGATLGALVALVFGFEGKSALPAVSLFAFAGALAASSLVIVIASHARARVEEILLGGIAITLAAGAISQGLHAIADQNALFAAAQWSLGQLPQVGFDRLELLLVPALLSLFMILSQRRGLQALALGDDWARSVGVSTQAVRVLVIVGASLGVGTSVALCGPIAFVGLLVPHLVRLFMAHQKSGFLLLCWFSGGVFLTLCDTLARFMLDGRELPVGVLTASLGAPTLFWLITKRSGSRGAAS